MPDYPTLESPTVHEESPVGGVIHSPASEYSKEMARWETRPREDGSVTSGMINAARRAGKHHGAFEHREYPKCVYRFEQTPNGIKLAEFQTAHSDVEERNLQSRGFHGDQHEAIAIVERANQAAAVGAANRAFHDRRMSSKAQREAAAADAATSRHLGEIPQARIKPRAKPGPKAKLKPAVPAVE